MKKISLMFVLLFILSGNLFSQWAVFQIPVPAGDLLKAVSFINSNTGVVGCNSIMRTTDAGQSWNEVLADIVVMDIQLKGNIGYASGSHIAGFLFKTTDAGQTWFSLNQYSPYLGWRKIHIIDDNIAIIVCLEGGGNNLRMTTDGGVTWPITFTTNEMYLVSGALLSGSYYAVTQDHLWQKVGVDWFMRSNGDMTAFSRLVSANNKFYLSGQKMFNGLYRGVVNATSDGGQSWQSSILNTVDQGICNEIAFSGPTGYGVGATFTNNSTVGKIYKNSDGQTWNQIYEFPNIDFTDLAVTDHYVYAVGRNGYIIRYDQTLTGINIYLRQIDDFQLNQNYPNPFNPTTKISYSVPKSSFVTIKVYDISGKEVSTLVNQEQGAGKYEAVFNGSKLCSGTYFYVFSAGDFSETKKMLLIK